MGPLAELIATDHLQTLEFFFLHLQDISGPEVDRPELLYNASVLAHYAQISTHADVERANTVEPQRDIRPFRRDTSLLADGQMMETAGAQCLVLAGFFEDQMRRRHNIRWYAELGASFFSRAAVLEASPHKARLLDTIARRFEPWRQRHARLSRELRDQPYLLTAAKRHATIMSRPFSLSPLPPTSRDASSSRPDRFPRWLGSLLGSISRTRYPDGRVEFFHRLPALIGLGRDVPALRMTSQLLKRSGMLTWRTKKIRVVAAALAWRLSALVDPAERRSRRRASRRGAAPPAQLGALAPANLAKPRPKPPFDLTGTWRHDGRSSTWRFVPGDLQTDAPGAGALRRVTESRSSSARPIATTSASAGPPACR